MEDLPFSCNYIATVDPTLKNPIVKYKHLLIFHMFSI